MTIVLLESGQDVHWIGGSLDEAIAEGIREGTRDGYLRQGLRTAYRFINKHFSR